MSSAKIVSLTDANWKSTVMESRDPVLVDFWAEWCGPCRALSPILDDLADEMDGLLMIGKVNVDENQALAAQFGIRSIPTLLLFRNGSVVGQINGAMSKQSLRQKLDGMLETV